MQKFDKLKIIVGGTLLVAILIAVFLKLNFDDKIEYNTCAGENIAEWVYTTGAAEYDTCVDKNNKLLFIDVGKALERVKEERKEALEYVKNEKNFDELSIKNYKKYYDYTKNIEEGHEYYEDLTFLNEFFKVLDNNILR